MSRHCPDPEFHPVETLAWRVCIWGVRKQRLYLLWVKAVNRQKHRQALGLSGKATSPAQSQAQACPKAPKKRPWTDLPDEAGGGAF